MAEDEVLDAADVPDEIVLEVRDTYSIPQGRVKRCWRVLGAHGVGRTSERGLYLALLRMTADAGWNSPEFDFSFRALALSLGLQPGRKAYDWIGQGLSHLHALNIHFQGMLEQAGGATRLLTVEFGLLSSVNTETVGTDIDCNCYWNSNMFASLRSAMEARQNENSSTSTEQFTSGLLRLGGPEQIWRG